MENLNQFIDKIPKDFYSVGYCSTEMSVFNFGSKTNILPFYDFTYVFFYINEILDFFVILICKLQWKDKFWNEMRWCFYWSIYKFSFLIPKSFDLFDQNIHLLFDTPKKNCRAMLVLERHILISPVKNTIKIIIENKKK